MNVKESAIRERLVKRGKKLVKELNGLELSKPKDLSETQYQEAGKLVDVRESDHPHAFVIACIMDRLIKAERAWFNPYRLSRRIGDFDFYTLLKLSEDEIQDHMKGPPALHRFPDKMSQYIHAALRHIADKYEGKAENIWAARPSSAGLVYRFLEFEGMGPKIATMAANILVREFKVPVRDHFSIDISPDRHVRRVFQRLGLIPKQASNEQIIYRARDLNPDLRRSDSWVRHIYLHISTMLALPSCASKASTIHWASLPSLFNVILCLQNLKSSWSRSCGNARFRLL